MIAVICHSVFVMANYIYFIWFSFVWWGLMGVENVNCSTYIVCPTIELVIHTYIIRMAGFMHTTYLLYNVVQMQYYTNA